jgi:hypothetical protein
MKNKQKQEVNDNKIDNKTSRWSGVGVESLLKIIVLIFGLFKFIPSFIIIGELNYLNIELTDVYSKEYIYCCYFIILLALVIAIVSVLSEIVIEKQKKLKTILYHLLAILYFITIATLSFSFMTKNKLIGEIILFIGAIIIIVFGRNIGKEIRNFWETIRTKNNIYSFITGILIMLAPLITLLIIIGSILPNNGKTYYSFINDKEAIIYNSQNKYILCSAKIEDNILILNTNKKRILTNPNSIKKETKQFKKVIIKK